MCPFSVKLYCAARDFALSAHADQKYGEHPYSYHLQMVFDNTVKILDELSDYNVLSSNLEFFDECCLTAWLHDTVEDTTVTPEDISANFGQSIADHVVHLTKIPGMSHAATIHSICLLGSDVALIVKLADVRANLSESLKNLDAGSAKRLVKYQDALIWLELAYYRRFLRRTEKK